MTSIARIIGFITLAIFLSVSAPPASAQIEADLSGTLKTHRFKQGDYRRRYKLYSPVNERELKGPRPLVLVIHGGASSDRGMLKLDKQRWNKLADQHGFYVAYPNAIGRLWDFGEGQTSSDLDNRVDDLAYFRRVIDNVSARKNIDKRRIFATGISRGGQSSYFLACNMPGRIRAIVPVAMSLPEFMLDECQDGPPVGVAIMNGTADRQVPYEGGWIKVRRKKRDKILSTDATVSLWKNRNGCFGAADSQSTIDKPGDGTSVAVSEWSRCSGAPVKLYKINNGGHTWPGGLQYLPERRVGKTSRDFHAADEAWAFFSGFR